jgi:hypothetical protein
MASGRRVHAIEGLFLESHQKDLQRRCRLCRSHPSEAWWPGDVHENNLNRLGQARRRYDQGQMDKCPKRTRHQVKQYARLTGRRRARRADKVLGSCFPAGAVRCLMPRRRIASGALWHTAPCASARSRSCLAAWKSLTRWWFPRSMMLPAGCAVLGSGQRKCRQRIVSCRSTRLVSSGPGAGMPQSRFCNA